MHKAVTVDENYLFRADAALHGRTKPLQTVVLPGIDERSMANLLPEILRGHHFQGNVPRALPSRKNHYKTPYRHLPDLHRSSSYPGHNKDLKF